MAEAEDPQKAAEYDQQHALQRCRRGRNSAGAKELAAGYTRGTAKLFNKGLPLVCCVSVIIRDSCGQGLGLLLYIYNTYMT